MRLRLTLGALLLAVVGAKAQNPMPVELSMVPTDAAIVLHVNVAEVWKSKIGESIRKMPWPEGAKSTEKAQPTMMAKPAMEKGKPAPVKPAAPVANPVESKPLTPYYDELAKKLKDAFGLEIGDINTLTIFFPKLKGPGDESTVCFIVTLNKAYDKEKVIKGFFAISGNKEFEKSKELGKDVYVIGEEKNPTLKLFTKDTMRIVITGPKHKGVPAVQTGEGPVSPALKAAADKATLMFNVNMAQLPEEIRGDDLPAELNPYKPLFQSQNISVVGKMDKDMLVLNGKVKTESPKKAGDAEKAIGNLLAFGRLALGQSVKGAEGNKDKQNSETMTILPLAKSLLDGLNAAQPGTDANDATLAMKLNTDVNAGALVALIGLPGAPGGASMRAQSQNNLKQLGLAMHNYHDANGRFPPAAICDKKGKPLLSWRVAILPYIEQNNVYGQFKLDEPWDSTHNKKLAESIKIKTFMLPGQEDTAENKTHYKLVIGKECVFNTAQSLRIAGITDGTSNTVMIVTAAEGVLWSKPDDIVFDAKADMKKLLLFNNDITSVCFSDGSVRAIKNTLSEKTLKALFTANGGEVVNPDE